MSKRDELIEEIIGLQNKRRQIRAAMRPKPIPSFDPSDDYTRHQLYGQNIINKSDVDNQIYRLVELVNLLPKIEKPKDAERREEIVRAIEGHAGRVQQLYRSLNSISDSAHRESINNLVNDHSCKIEDLKLILSLI